MEATARRTGWVSLVAILLVIAGAFNVLWGLLALGVSFGGTEEAVTGDLTDAELEGLGIAGLVVGVIQFITGIGIFRRAPAALVAGLVIAVIGVLLNFAYHQVLDGWAFSGLFVNAAIIVILTLRRHEFG